MGPQIELSAALPLELVDYSTGDPVRFSLLNKGCLVELKRGCFWRIQLNKGVWGYLKGRV